MRHLRWHSDTGHTATGCYSWTGKEWKEDSSKTWAAPGFDQDDTHPVVCVSLEDAQAYARWLSDKTGERYRLPTEAEWEYTARAGTETIRYWGDDANEACRYGNVADQAMKKEFPDWTGHECSDNYAYTAPVGYFRANKFGLFDMLGNVWEWTCSSYTDTYNGSERRCQSGDERVSRGGSWDNGPRHVRSAGRNGGEADSRGNTRGFRLAQDI